MPITIQIDTVIKNEDDLKKIEAQVAAARKKLKAESVYVGQCYRSPSSALWVVIKVEEETASTDGWVTLQCLDTSGYVDASTKTYVENLSYLRKNWVRIQVKEA